MVDVSASSAYDYSARVKGGVRRVFKYVADVEHLPQWYPGVTSVQRVKGEGMLLRSQYKVDREIVKFKHTSSCEIVGLEPGKKVIVAAASQWYEATHELYFMSDPTDSSFTNVRYINRIQLKNAVGAIQPLISGFLRRIPEDSLSNLVRLLNRPDTPLRHIQLDAVEEAAEGRGGKGAWSWQSVWQGMGMGPLPAGSPSPSHSSPPPSAAASSSFVDTLGYYSILGLDPKRHSLYSADEVKAAYRKAAMELHPDRVVAAPGLGDARAQQSATLKFQALQRAYTCLKNEDHRKAYDRGELLEELVH